MPRASSLLQRLRALTIRLGTDGHGATAIEYGLIMAVVVLVMLIALQGLAGVTVGMWNTVDTKVTAATPSR